MKKKAVLKGKPKNLRAKGLSPKRAARVKGGIGSATSGAGGGKIKFSEFTIKKTTDMASPE